MENIPVRNIFIAVSKKESLDGLLQVLERPAVKFWGTLGSIKYVKDKGYSAVSVVKGFDFDGRVKTLSRPVFSAVLADRSKPEHVKELALQNIPLMDLVIVDLYPLNKDIFPESMDIGGQSLIRSAIKNFANVAVSYDEASLQKLIEEIKKNNGQTTLAFRKEQAKSASKFIAERCTLESEMF